MNSTVTNDRSGQDRFQQTMSSLFARFGGSSLVVVLVLLVVLGGMALLWTISERQEVAEAAAWQAAAEAIEKNDAGKLESIMKGLHTGRARSTMALLMAAQVHSKAVGEQPMPPKDRADHLDSARKLYVDFLATGDHPLVPLARLNLAKTMEDSGNFEGANAAFMEAERSGREGPLTFVASEAIWGQARCASHLGRPEQALNLVNSAVDRVGASSRPRWYQAACAFRDTLRKVDPKDDLRLKKDVVSDSPDTPAAPQIPEAPPPAPVTGDDAGTRG